MNEAGRRLAMFAGGLAAVFGLGLLLGATVGPDASEPGGGHDMDEMDHGEMDHPTTTTTTVVPPPPSPPAGEPGP